MTLPKKICCFSQKMRKLKQPPHFWPPQKSVSSPHIFGFHISFLAPTCWHPQKSVSGPYIFGPHILFQTSSQRLNFELIINKDKYTHKLYKLFNFNIVQERFPDSFFYRKEKRSNLLLHTERLEVEKFVSKLDLTLIFGCGKTLKNPVLTLNFSKSSIFESKALIFSTSKSSENNFI